MIISFDGNVFSGKTSLIKALSELSFGEKIDEQGAFLKNDIPSHVFSEKEIAISAQLNYLQAEEERMKHIDENKTCLLDRSFVSMAAHVYALYQVNNLDIRDWFLKEIEVRIYSGKVAIPDIFCFVTCDHEIIEKRASMNISRNTGNIYFNKRYLESIDRFNQKWIQMVEGVTIDTSVILPVQLAETFISKMAFLHKEKPSIKQIHSFLQDLILS